jgi:predicted nucleotidyltransferase
MKTLAEIQITLEEQKPHLQEKYGVKGIGVLGSCGKNEQNSESDIDILIELERPPKISLIGLVELEDCLSETLGVKADLVSKKKLRKRIGKRILDEVVPL